VAAYDDSGNALNASGDIIVGAAALAGSAAALAAAAAGGAGGAAGRAAGAVADAAEDVWRDSTLGDAARDAADAAQQGGEAALAAGQDGAEYIAKNAPGAAAAAADAAQQGADAVAGVAQDGIDYAKAQGAGEAAADGAQAASGSSAAQQVAAGARAAADAAQQGAEAAYEVGQDGAEYVAKNAPGAAAAAGEFAGEAADAAQQGAEAAYEVGQDGAEYVAKNAPGAAAAAGEFAGEAADGAADAAAIAASAAGQAGEAIGDAGSAVAEGASDAYNSETGQAIVSGAGKAAGVVAEGAEKGAELAGQAASTAWKAAPGVAEDTAKILSEGFGVVEPAFSMGADEAKKAFNAAAGLASAGCMALVPLLRVEIFRDFSQVMGVVFASAFRGAEGAAAAAANSFGRVYSFFALDFANAMRSKEAVIFGIVLVVILAVACIIGYLWMVFFSGITKMAAEDKVRMGNEAISFSQMAKEKSTTIWLVGQVLTISLSAYLPVSQLVFEVLACDPGSFVTKAINKNCDNGPLQALAYGLMILYIFPLPIFCWKMVEQFKPTGSPENPDMTFDQDGMLVPFDDKIYNELVENSLDQQLQPFRTLYQGFERKASSYKIGIMCFKCFVVLMTVVLATTLEKDTGAAIFQFILLLTQLVLMGYYMPFVNPTDDLMDVQGRFVGVFVSFNGIIISAVKSNGGTDFLGVLVILANTYNTIAMTCITFYAFQSVRTFVKEKTGRFSFSDTARNMTDLGAIDAIANWNSEKEIKHRVWQTWWNGCLLLKCPDPEVPGRLVQLQKDTIDNGLETIKNHWDGERIPQVRDNRVIARMEHEGMDCFWNNDKGCVDGHLDSKTFFGKMYIKAYPFTMVMVYDDAADEVFIRDNELLHEFIALQNSATVAGKKEIRKNLRAIARAKSQIHWPFSQMETHHHIEDGWHMETVTDSEGNKKQKKVIDYSDISLEMHYTNGVINIGVQYPDKKQSPGFNFSMGYSDGYGHAIKPRTGEPYNPKNHSTTITNLNHIGCSGTFDRTPLLDKLFEMDVCRNAIVEHVPAMQAEVVQYREDLITKDRAANAVLGDGFWYFVYNQPSLPRDDLVHYLTMTESNEVLRALPETESGGMDFLYKRLAVIRSRGFKSAFWFVFWEDFWLNNKQMELVDLHKDNLDPVNATAMCYNYKEREELEEELKGWGLISEDYDPDSTAAKYCSIFAGKEYFSKPILDALYDRLGGKILPAKRSSLGIQPHGVDALAAQEES
jgi:hypothetical protein